ncbi:glutamyl-tRNA amidotransferase [Erythrobacter sp.]|uniref:glutamyl-tRNA amidotransferase n=1 Tax=Erythrobacter sp. TaxID=1042 RepID=UPI002EA93DD7|nr:glutamyl-tRNA amidotransferase [Erythrobacter sp.]
MSLLEWTGVAIAIAVMLVMAIPLLLKGRIDAGEARFDSDGRALSDGEHERDED